MNISLEAPSIGAIYGTGAVNQVAFWQTPTRLTGNSQFLFDGTNLKLPVGGDIRPSSDSTSALNIANAAGTDFVTFDTTNLFVGIGTASPQQKFVVSTGAIGFEFIPGNTGGTAVLQTYDRATSAYGNFGFDTNTTGGRTMTLLTNGNVGIGTTGPGQKLVVSGGNANVTSGAASTFLRVTNSTGGLTNADVDLAVLNTGEAQIYQYGNYPMSFWTNSLQRMTILSGGNVGINDTTPDAMLDIVSNGTTIPGLIITNAASQTASAFQVANSSGTGYVTIGPDVLAAGGTQNFLNITGTLPTTISAEVDAVSYQITSAGSSSFNQKAFLVTLLAGYTGDAKTVGGEFNNNVAGTGNDLLLGTTNVNPLGNVAVSGFSPGTTTGLKVGGFFEASGGSPSIGAVGKATTAKNSATTIGVLGIGLNTGTTPVQLGGYFGLHSSTPTFASAALMADNGSTTSDIFVARDNGTETFVIENSGLVYLSNQTMTGDSNVSNFLNVTGTLPTTTTASAHAVNLVIATAGSSANQQTGLISQLGAGYTGTSFAIALHGDNNVAGTGTSIVGLGANYGGYFNCRATTVGTNIGAYANAGAGNINIGFASTATAAKNSATNIGGFFLGRNTGTTPTQVGVYAGLNSSAPSFSSAALMCDNADQAVDIFVARDNGTAVFTIADGGTTITIAPNATTLVATGTGANGLKLKNLKNAAASALSGTQLDIEIDIGGTPYYFTVYPTKA